MSQLPKAPELSRNRICTLYSRFTRLHPRKECINTTPLFDFLTSVVAAVPDVTEEKPKRTRKPKAEGSGEKKPRAKRTPAKKKQVEEEEMDSESSEEEQVPATNSAIPMAARPKVKDEDDDNYDDL